MIPRGLRHIPTAHPNRFTPTSRAKVFARLVGLEHERERLKRELEVSLVKKRQAEERLAEIGQEIERFRQTLEEASPGCTRQVEGVEAPSEARAEVVLEY